MNIQGYSLSDQLYRSHQSVIYRALRDSDQLPVILKIYNNEYPVPEEIQKFRREFKITQLFANDDIIKAYELFSQSHYQIMVLEDFGGTSLESSLKGNVLALEPFLKLALQVTAALARVHQKNIIHKDINPANIVWNRDKNITKLIDFGISSELPRETSALKAPSVLEGTLAFISPEQTGRMNRAVDYRTDFYSLGITFYKLLTGNVPFEGEDALELIHSHIARHPVPLDRVLPGTPIALSRIINKLMAKNAEERYQSAYGLEADLKRCLQEFQADGRISSFKPGLLDVSDKFHIPQKLYGRHDELKTLLSGFERVSQGETEWMLVSGYSGIGKSALIHEIHKPIIKHRGYFVSGKYDQFRREVPYSAFIQSFQKLLRLLLTEDESKIESWRIKLLEALGSNGQVLIDVIPALELLIGPQPVAEKLAPAEARNRFLLVFQKFIQVFANAEHPLAIFLDDLQWADLAGLQLIKAVLSDPETQYIYIIGAYRENEVHPSHPLMMTIKELEETNAHIHDIFLKGLKPEQINRLASETLHAPPEQTLPLAQLVHRKTEGNPFFVNEFLKTLYTKGAIQFKPGEGWSWKMSQIQNMAVTDNVVDLIVEKITVLTESTQEILKTGAAIGNQFDLPTLLTVYKQDAGSALSGLKEAQRMDLLLLMEHNYHFAHDRIQEAAYSLLEPELKSNLHLDLARHVLAGQDESEIKDKLFFIVDHMNAGKGAISSPEEKHKLLLLNLSAGRKAKSAAAYGPAFTYFSHGIELLEQNSWREDYKNTLSLYEEAGQSAYLISDFDAMKKYSQILLNNALTVQDRIKTYETRILTYMAENRLTDGLDLSLQVLRELGQKFPDNPSPLHVLGGLIRLKLALFGKKVETLIDLPDMEDKNILSVMNLISDASPIAYWTRPNLLPLFAFRMVRLSLKYGNAPISCFAYTTYSLILGGVLEDLKGARVFGDLAQNLNDKLEDRSHTSRTLMSLATFITHYHRPVREGLSVMMDAYKIGLETGDLEFAGYSLMTHSINSLLAGRKLKGLTQEMKHNLKTLEMFNQQTTLHTAQMYCQMALNLADDVDDPVQLAGPVYSEAVSFPHHFAENDRAAIFNARACRTVLANFFCNYETSYEQGLLALPFKDSSPALFLTVSFSYYLTLTCVALYPKSSFLRRIKLRRMIKKNLKRYRKFARFSPQNHAHKYDLMRAEFCRLNGKMEIARRLYESAVQNARENRFLLDEARALELTALYWRELGSEDLYNTYIVKSYQVYRMWGAERKIKHMEAEYPGAFQEIGVETTSGGTQRITSTLSSISTTSERPTHKLDLLTVMKGSQAISGEIVFSRFLEKMMKIVIESAGAQKSALILERSGSFRIEAICTTEKMRHLNGASLEDADEICAAIVKFTARAGESLVFKDASQEGDFTDDDYVIRHKLKSVLCTPVLNQGRIVALIYLENNLTTGAFSRDRLEVLNLLSSQIGISIENAQLYGNLEEKVEDRTQQLQKTLDDVQSLLKTVQKLKDKQDGDYYLTSLLLDPLAQNDVHSKSVSVEFLIQQNKRFRFQKWKSEIGGDLCIAHSIRLENRPITVFLNADAMGKSIQGAGGALVLGAVFQSLIERTRSKSIEQNQNGSAWLRDSFLELQKVFVSFNGSMLISLILGLVEDDTGALYFINAEHPWLVRYRKGKAEFLEDRALLHKLGAPDFDGEIIIQEHQLEAGDQIFCASDGRDDILVNTGKGEAPRIISDINNFLGHIEEAQGEPKEILESIQSRGELTDDFSLLKLRYEPGD